MNKTLCLVLTLGLVTATAAGAGGNNRVEVIANPTPSGSAFVLRGTADGTTDPGFLISKEAAGEHLMRWRFRILLDTAGAFGPAWSMAPGERFSLLNGWEQGTGRVNLYADLRRAPTGRYTLVVRAKTDGGGNSLIVQGLKENSYQILTIEWAAAGGPGANDGLVRLTRKGVAPKENTGLDNDEHYIDATRFGLVRNVDASTTGSFYLDDFSSFRTLAP